MLAKNELNNIETLISQALTDSEISHKEFKVIVDEKEEYGKMKENVRMMESKKKWCWKRWTEWRRRWKNWKQ